MFQRISLPQCPRLTVKLSRLGAVGSPWTLVCSCLLNHVHSLPRYHAIIFGCLHLWQPQISFHCRTVILRNRMIVKKVIVMMGCVWKWAIADHTFYHNVQSAQVICFNFKFPLIRVRVKRIFSSPLQSGFGGPLCCGYWGLGGKAVGSWPTTSI
jgi:hypothetical protein